MTLTPGAPLGLQTGKDGWHSGFPGLRRSTIRTQAWGNPPHPNIYVLSWTSSSAWSNPQVGGSPHLLKGGSSALLPLLRGQVLS